MPRYDYSHCGITWEKRVDFNSRDSVRCDCGKLASRQMALFNFTGATYVGTNKFAGASQALGVKGIESAKEVDRLCEERGAHPVDPYYRQPPLPKPAEIPDEDFLPYLS